MGYDTHFTGHVTIVPPLNDEEIVYINTFSSSRRMHRDKGPYFVADGHEFGQENADDVIDYKTPDPSQPSLWCNWRAEASGTIIKWAGNKKFYSSAEWMQYIIDHFIGENPVAKSEEPLEFGFLEGHSVNGEIFAHGEDNDDIWKMEVVDGKVTVVQGTITYE